MLQNVVQSAGGKATRYQPSKESILLEDEGDSFLISSAEDNAIWQPVSDFTSHGPTCAHIGFFLQLKAKNIPI
jgi:hypothetical protein